MSVNFSDAHCHIADAIRGGAERAREILRACAASEIRTLMLGGVDPEDWDRQAELVAVAAEPEFTSNFPLKILISFGLHPWAVNKLSKSECDAILVTLTAIFSGSLTANPVTTRPSALGECGLDFAHRLSQAQKTLQIDVFRQQCELAARLRVPVVVHSVGAFDATFEILKEYAGSLVGVLLHGFSGDKGQVARYLKLGTTGWVKFSIGPVKKRAYDEVALRAIPNEALLIESDAHEDPRVVLDVARDVAAIRSEDSTLLIERSTENLNKFLGL